MRAMTLLALGLGALLVAPGCGKDDKTTDKTPGPEADKGTGVKGAIGAAKFDVAALAERIGVQPGPIAIEEDAGGEGVITARTGTVAVRRAGEEVFTDVAKDGAKVYAGDQIRASTDSSAVMTLADETVVELAEDTTVAIGDRDATADPASSAVVMGGVARFTVSQRGAGEGPFLVFTTAGIIGTKGTTYVIAVAATGDVRVGVEEGAVEVAGGAALDVPVLLSAGNTTVLSADGSAGGAIAFATDDWGTWRDETEAGATATALAEVHIKLLEDLELELEGGYDDVEVLTEAVATAEAPVIEAEEANDSAAYDVAAPELGVTVEASYMASTRLQYLTYAMLGHAYVTGELYARFPEELEPVFVPAAPRVYGAILYHKKYHQVVHAHVRPWRTKYYYHHPRGRVNAVAVGVEVPAFYKKRKLKALADGAVAAKFEVKLYRAPRVAKVDKKKKVWVGVPAANWSVKVKAKPRKVRGKANWYVRVDAPKAKVWGVKVTGKAKAVFEVKAPTARADVDVRIGVKKRPDGPARKVGVRVGGAGGLKIGVKGKAGKTITVDGNKKGGVDVEIKGPGGGKVEVRTNDKGGAKVKVKGKNGGKAGVKVKAGGKTGVDIKGGVKGGVKIKGGAKAGVKVKKGQ